MRGSTLHLSLADEAATLALGAALAQGLAPGTRIYLSGDLGAGKTTLTRGLLRALGHTGSVKSPTYTLVEPYELSGLDLHHFDFYRFENSDEWNDAGFRELFDSTTVCLVEWPERAARRLPDADLHIRLEHIECGRSASLTAHSAAGQAMLAAAAST
ncbi:MAG: tRNA (adenosine(37)-N6)-threonylcarbamoyltransferase complex ATPase subunit type 1 TsaE [Betaproteobacteria bacterium]|nr:tRNA (adenosine(37)-N6)-threonylcarbamoyltransferase complex ATPase subunit type 1 TsaE [Betaproteobacteria bacterium]